MYTPPAFVCGLPQAVCSAAAPVPAVSSISAVSCISTHLPGKTGHRATYRDRDSTSRSNGASTPRRPTPPVPRRPKPNAPAHLLTQASRILSLDARRGLARPAAVRLAPTSAVMASRVRAHTQLSAAALSHAWPNCGTARTGGDDADRCLSCTFTVEAQRSHVGGSNGSNSGSCGGEWPCARSAASEA
jgi:hypothetical protein